MIRLDKDYSPYVDETDEEFPNGKAINVSEVGNFDGTPIKAELVNDFLGFFQAVFAEGFKGEREVSGENERVGHSDVLDALKQIFAQGSGGIDEFSAEKIEILHCFEREKGWFFIRIDGNRIVMDYDDTLVLPPPECSYDAEKGELSITLDYPYDMDIEETATKNLLMTLK